MATVASIIVSLEAQNAQFSQALKAAQRDITQLQAAAEKGGGIADFFKGAVGGAAAGLAAGSVGKAFELATGAVHEAVESVREWVEESIAAQDAAFKTAAGLRVHVATLEGLQIASKRVGLGAEEAQISLQKLQADIGKAATRGGDAAEAFTRLGLNAKQLAGQSLDQNIRQIATAIAAIQNPAEQAAAAGDVFGQRLGPKLLPLLRQGAEGIDKVIEEAKRAGVALDDVDAAKLSVAQRQLTELGERFEGVKNQLAVALAPTIIAVGKHIADLIPPADKVRIAVTAAFGAVVMTAAKVQDELKAFEVSLLHAAATGSRLASLLTPGDAKNVLQAQATYIDRWASKLDYSKSAAAAAYKFLVDINKEATKSANELAAGLGKGAAAPVDEDVAKVQDAILRLKQELAGLGKPKEIADLENLSASVDKVDEVRRLLDDINEKKLKLDVDKSITDLAKQFTDARIAADAMRAALGGAGVGAFLAGHQGQLPAAADDAKRLNDLRNKGATDADIENAKKYLAAQRAEQQYLDAVQRAKSVFEEAKGPIQKYKDELGNLKDLQSRGLIDRQTYQSAVAKANKDLLSAANESGGSNGRAAAETRRFDFTLAQDNHVDPIRNLLEEQKQHRRALEDSKFYLSQLYQFGLNSATPTLVDIP